MSDDAKMMRYYKFVLNGINNLNSFREFLKELMDRMITFGLVKKGLSDVNLNIEDFLKQISDELAIKNIPKNLIANKIFNIKLSLKLVNETELENQIKKIDGNADINKINKIINDYSYTLSAIKKDKELIKKLSEGDSEKGLLKLEDKCKTLGIEKEDVINLINSVIHYNVIIRREKKDEEVNEELIKTLTNEGLISWTLDLKLSGDRKSVKLSRPNLMDLTSGRGISIVCEGFNQQYLVGKIVLFLNKRGKKDLIIDVLTLPGGLTLTGQKIGFDIEAKLLKGFNKGIIMHRLINLKKGYGSIGTRRAINEIKQAVEDGHDKKSKYEAGSIGNHAPYMSTTICPECLKVKENAGLKKELENKKIGKYSREIKKEDSSLKVFFIDNIDTLDEFNEVVKDVEEEFEDKVSIKGFYEDMGIGSLVVFDEFKKLGRSKINLVDVTTLIKERVIAEFGFGDSVRDVRRDVKRDLLLRFRAMPLIKRTLTGIGKRDYGNQIRVISEGKGISQAGYEKFAQLKCNEEHGFLACELPTYDISITNKNEVESKKVLHSWGITELMDDDYFDQNKNYVKAMKKEEKNKGTITIDKEVKQLEQSKK